MDIQSCSWEWNHVFAPLQNNSLPTLQHQNILLQHHFSKEKDRKNNSHLLALSEERLFLSELDSTIASPFASSLLSFDLKFETLHQTNNDLKTPKIGLKFYVEEQKGCQFYAESSIIDEWVKHLSKLLHQKGFHQRFKPLRKLGKGNFATVYEVQRFQDGKKFAVKAFSKQTCFATNKGKESLTNELTMMRTLNKDAHKNVLQLEGVYQSDNSIYVVQELIGGGGLFSRVQERNGYFTASEVRQCMLGLVSGLNKMHSKRIMHRDLKPENIMLRGPFSMEPIIVDFGLACNSDHENYLFYRCGTPGYVAPQIIALAQNGHVEPQCDIFSAGAIFHLLLTRKALFEGTQYNEVYKKNKEMNIRLQGELYEQVDPQAIDLLSKMLLADPKTRIKAADAMKHPYFQAVPEGEHKASPSLTVSMRKG